jgi:hypothetical protein
VPGGKTGRIRRHCRENVDGMQFAAVFPPGAESAEFDPAIAVAISRECFLTTA